MKMRVILGLLIFFVSPSFAKIGTYIINGSVVPAGKFEEVVFLTFQNNKKCSATLVGPKAILMAGACARRSQAATFMFRGAQYTVKAIPYTVNADIDIALGVVTPEIKNLDFATVSAMASANTGVTILGYGCHEVGGGDLDFGTLRMGQAVITEVSNYKLIVKGDNQAHLCMADPGGPAYTIMNQNGKEIHQVVGINSQGNTLDYSDFTRTDIQDVKTFLKTTAMAEQIEVCGITKDCQSPPPLPAPTCKLKATPDMVELGSSLTLTLTPEGSVTSASINQTSVSPSGGNISITPTAIGNYKATGKVTGPGGEGMCEATYTVKDQSFTPPSCEISANPSLLIKGQSTMLVLESKGTVNKATIDGTEVSIPTGKLTRTTTMTGTFRVEGIVYGPNNTKAQCYAQYTVKEEDLPSAPTCTLTAAPTWITLGGNITLSLTTKNQVTSAQIDGMSVGIPNDSISIKPDKTGVFTSKAIVVGPGGTATCGATYTVGDAPSPTLPNYTVVPTYCGQNTLLETPVRQVCLGVVKVDNQQGSVIREALLLTYVDTKQEVLPIIHKNPKESDAIRLVEELMTYANALKKDGMNILMDTRKSTLTRTKMSGSDYKPTSIEGRGGQGHYFIVESLTPTP